MARNISVGILAATVTVKKRSRVPEVDTPFLVKKMVLMFEMDVGANVEVMTKVEALQMTEEPHIEACQQEVEDEVVPVGQVEVVVEGVMMEVMEAEEVQIVVVVK